MQLHRLPHSVARRLRSAALAWAVVSGALATSHLAAATADCPTCATPMAGCGALPRGQDQLWLVSDRRLGCTAVDAAGSNLEYWHYAAGAGWQRSTNAAFSASDDPDAVTHVWIHGNRIDWSEAFRTGWTVYAAIARRAADQRPLRFVIWSWPSERVPTGQLEDIRIKGARTTNSARHLARFLDGIATERQISLSGYSFGARIATGALQLMGGGALQGQTMTFNTAARRPRLDVTLLAAAIDNDWLLPGHCHGQALTMVDHLLLVNNGCDRALKRYHMLYGWHCDAEALGYAGLPWTGPWAAGKISQFDACCYVGPEHDWSHYFASPAVVDRMLPLVFQSQPPVAATARAGKAAAK